MKKIVVVPLSDPGINIDTRKIPSYTATDLAQAALSAVRQDYQRPEVREEYERWKAERERRS
ncbi:MAG: hypothetical protein IJH70_15865 [Oscillospiraceae bacterium]|nr:hypothetical protein [Oscillospiraceae bacterium]